VRRQASRSSHRADQQAARYEHQGPRTADPQADRRGLAQDQGREALDDLLPRRQEELSMPEAERVSERWRAGSVDTIPRRVLRQAAEHPSSIAYQAKVNGRWQPTTWHTFAGQIRTAARALMTLGLPRGGKVSILGFNRPEWVILDHA